MLHLEASDISRPTPRQRIAVRASGSIGVAGMIDAGDGALQAER